MWDKLVLKMNNMKTLQGAKILNLVSVISLFLPYDIESGGLDPFDPSEWLGEVGPWSQTIESKLWFLPYSLFLG